MAEFLDFDAIRSVISYNCETGVLTWKVSQSNRVKVGDEAGHINSFGYRSVRVLNKLHQAHRLAWLLHYGEMPANHLDHIDGNRLNNSISNLRDVSNSVNQQNLKSAKKNNRSSGLLGAYKSGDRWCSKITVLRKVISLGSFKTADQAHAAYINAKREMHAGCTI